MKILLCTNSFENILNGPAMFANLILDINQLYPEHEVHILTEDINTKRQYVHKVNVNFPGFLKPFGQFIRMFLYNKALNQIHSAFQFDIVIYNFSFIGLITAIFSRHPTVGMLNDDNNLHTKLTNFKPAKLWLKRFIFKFFERLSTKHHKAIIANSDYLLRQIISEYNMPGYKVFRLYKAVDFSQIQFYPKRPFTLPIKILFVKADYIRGGVAILSLALKKLEDYPFELTIVGPDIKFENNIKKLFLNIKNLTLKFKGEQPHETVLKYMSNSDILCIPALNEGLGVANIEALAFGLPVVTTNAGGIPEVMDGDNNGWIANVKDANSLTQVLKDCIENPELRLKKSLAGKDYIKFFVKQEMFNNLISIVEKVLEKNNGKRKVNSAVL